MKKKIILAFAMAGIMLLTIFSTISVNATTIKDEKEPKPDGGETYTLYGWVYDGKTGEPLGGVQAQWVIYHSGVAEVLDETTTTSDGYYELHNIPKFSNEPFVFKKEGYRDKHVNVYNNWILGHTRIQIDIDVSQSKVKSRSLEYYPLLARLLQLLQLPAFNNFLNLR